MLNKEDVPTKRGAKWISSTGKRILTNDKYTGDVLFQKTYTNVQFNCHHNKGEKNIYLAENHHEAIVSQEDFETAGKMLRQHALERNIRQDSEKCQKRYAFSGKIICGECDSTFKRRTHCTAGKNYAAWCCNGHLTDKNSCYMMCSSGTMR